MLINRVKNLVYSVGRVYKLNYRSGKWQECKVRFDFSNWNKSDILKKLQEDISQWEKQVVDLDSGNVAYFAKNNWKVDYNQKERAYVYGRVDQNYEVRVLTPVKYNPPNNSIDQNVQQEMQSKAQKSVKNSKQKLLNYSLARVFVKKNGSSKWLTAQMAVFQNAVQVVSVFFTSLQPSLKKQVDEYHGPELTTLSKDLVSSMGQMLLGFGLSKQMIINMVLNSSSQVDKLDVDWLKDMKQIWN